MPAHPQGPEPQAAVPAVYRKQAVEAELVTCKARLRAVEAQLLEVLEEKLRLRQEVEAWEVGQGGQLGLGGVGSSPAPALNLLSCPRRTCSGWCSSGSRVSCRENPGVLWAPMGTLVLPGVPGTDWGAGGENSSQDFGRTVFIH